MSLSGTSRSHQPKRHLAIQCQADIAITDAQNLRHKPSHHAHQQAAGRRLQPLAPLGQLPEAQPDEKQQLDEADGNDAADQPQGGIEEELDGVDELIGGDVKQRLVAEQQVEHDPRGGRAQHDGTQHRRVEIAHHLLEREKDRRHGRVEGRRQGRGSSDGHQRPDPLRSQSQPPAKDRCQTRSNLDRRAFAAQRDAGASETEQQKNFPTTVRKLMKPSRRNNAALVCGIPLPRALGK